MQNLSSFLAKYAQPVEKNEFKQKLIYSRRPTFGLCHLTFWSVLLFMNILVLRSTPNTSYQTKTAISMDAYINVPLPSGKATISSETRMHKILHLPDEEHKKEDVGILKETLLSNGYTLLHNRSIKQTKMKKIQSEKETQEYTST